MLVNNSELGPSEVLRSLARPYLPGNLMLNELIDTHFALPDINKGITDLDDGWLIRQPLRHFGEWCRRGRAAFIRRFDQCHCSPGILDAANQVLILADCEAL